VKREVDQLRSTAGTGVPQRPASAAIEQFLLGEVQVATVIDAQPASHEAQSLGTWRGRLRMREETP
jgi:hypothetical protein